MRKKYILFSIRKEGSAWECSEAWEEWSAGCRRSRRAPRPRTPTQRATRTVLSIKKYHTFAQISGQQHHNNRDFPLPNVDASLSYRNATLREAIPGADYTTSWRQAIENAKEAYGHDVPVRRNAVLMLEIVTSFSPEANAEWMEEAFGAENVLSCTLHMDESTPHIHTEVVPIDERGRLCAKSFTSGRLAMMGLHTSYAKAMERFGLDRGAEHSKASKVELREFYRGLKEAYELPLPKRREGEPVTEYTARLDDYARSLRVALYNASLQIDKERAGQDTAVAQALSKYAEAMELFEDIAEVSGLSDEKVEDRIREYRMLEGFAPHTAAAIFASSAVESAKEKGHSYDDLPVRFRRKKRAGDVSVVERPAPVEEAPESDWAGPPLFDEEEEEELLGVSKAEGLQRTQRPEFQEEDW